MEHPKFRPGAKFIGIILILTAIFGWIFSLAGLASTLWVRPHLISYATSGVRTLQSTLTSTNDLLEVVDSSLTSATSGLIAVVDTLNGFSDTLDSTSAVMESISTVVSTDLSKVVDSTIAAMDGLEATTRMVDSTLNLLSAVPFFGGAAYKPETPLNESIADISTSMEDMPVSLEAIGTQLEGTAETLQPIPASLSSLTKELDSINASLENAHQIVDQYQTSLTNIDERLTSITANIPLIVNVIVFSIFGLLLWVFLAQFGLFTQGLERMRQ